MSSGNLPLSALYQTTISNSPITEDSFRFSNASFHSDKGNFLTESFKINKSKTFWVLKALPSFQIDFLICPKINFVSESQWNEADNCQICSSVFDKLKANFRHHCRVCGISVCGLCSIKKINEKRACDLCFLRIESQEIIERKEKVLALKEETIKDLEITVKVTKERMIKVFDEIQAQKVENTLIEKENQAKIETSKKKLAEAKELCTNALENLKNSNESLSRITEIKTSRSEEFDRSLKRNKDLALAIEKRKLLKQSKVEELEILIKQIAKTKTTRSYADIFEYLDINEDVLSVCLENQSESDLDDLSNFVHKMRKSLAKASAKKSLMIGHSLIKKSQAKREKKLGSGQAGLCCGNSECRLF